MDNGKAGPLGSSKFRGITANNKEYFKIFLYKNYKILLNSAVPPRNLLDPFHILEVIQLHRSCFLVEF